MKLDYLNGTEYHIQQGQEMYHFNSDTELLGRFMNVKKEESVLDIGCNNGALLFYAKSKNAKHLCGIDLFEEVIALAKENFDRYEIEVELHVCPLQDFQHEPFSLIICNPPYFNTQNDRLKNQNKYRKAARHEEYLTLDELFQNVKRLLKDNGRFAMIYRPDRLSEVIQCAQKYGMHAKRMKIAYRTKESEAKSILLEFVKNPDILLRVEKPAFENDRDSFD